MSSRHLTLDEAVARVLEEPDEEEVEIAIIPPGTQTFFPVYLSCNA